MSIFKENLLPLPLVLVKVIQMPDVDAFDALAMARTDVADIEFPANPAASSELTNPVHGKRRCVGQVGLA
jgi:hypothetical protein